MNSSHGQYAASSSDIPKPTAASGKRKYAKNNRKSPKHLSQGLYYPENHQLVPIGIKPIPIY
jgi:hypothetical protein